MIKKNLSDLPNISVDQLISDYFRFPEKEKKVEKRFKIRQEIQQKLIKQKIEQNIFQKLTKKFADFEQNHFSED